MEPSLDIALILTLLVSISGLIALLDKCVLQSRRKQSGKKPSFIVEYAHEFFPLLLIIWLIRSFVVQPYRVPTGSLEPTVQPGDFILVNQFAYGLRVPVIKKKIVDVGEPKRGDIILFYWPVNPKIIFVKRLVGLPGDHVVYKDKKLFINGHEQKQSFIRQEKESQYSITHPDTMVLRHREVLAGKPHDIILDAFGGITDNVDVIVPRGEYFFMGDNRDASDDSRFWGTVPDKNIIGRVEYVILSWNSLENNFRWARSGLDLHE